MIFTSYSNDFFDIILIYNFDPYNLFVFYLKLMNLFETNVFISVK